jgi:hypothetical protein
MHISELAGIVKTDANKLGRILRLMASRHVFRESKWFLDSHTLVLTVLMVSCYRRLGEQSTERAAPVFKPFLEPGMQYVSFFEIWFEFSSQLVILSLEEGRCTGSLPDVMQDPQWSHSSDPRKTCLNRHTGFEGTFFDYIESVRPP